MQGSQEGQLRPGCQGLGTLRVNAREVLSGANQKFVAHTELSLRWLGQERRNVAEPKAIGMIRDYAGRPEFAVRLVTTLGFVEHPTPAATAALVALSEHGSDLSVVQRAKLATGIMGSRLRQSSESDDQKRAAVLEDRFSQWLKAASTDAERYDALAALGNLGPKDLAALKALPVDAPARLQAEAYFAMRFSPNPSVPNLLAQSYDQYPDLFMVFFYCIPRGDGAGSFHT